MSVMVGVPGIKCYYTLLVQRGEAFGVISW